jgi:potassium efflux system protein
VKIKKMNFVLSVVILMLWLTSAVWGQVDGTLSDGDETSLIAFEQAVAATREDLKVLENDLAAEKILMAKVLDQREGYRIQMNSLRNFLIVPETRVFVLEKGIEEVDISISSIQSQIQGIKERETNIGQTFSLVKEKIGLIDQRIKELTAAKDKTISSGPGIKEFKAYRSIKEQQHKVLVSITGLLASQININNELLNAFKDIKETLKTEIKDKKGGHLFQRNGLELKNLLFPAFKREVLVSFTAVRQLFDSKRLLLKWSLFKDHMNLKTSMVIVGFLLISFLGFRGMSLIRQKEADQNIFDKRAGYPLIVLERSLVLIFWILLTLTLSKTQVYLIFPDGVKFFKSFLIIILMTRIASDSIRLIAREKGPVLFDVLHRWRNPFIYGIRLYSLVYLLVYRFLSLENMFLVSIRIFSEILLVAGVFLFWKAYQNVDTPAKSMGVKFLNLVSKMIVITGLFSDIAGYGAFAAYWYLSWGSSIVIICVCVMLLYSIKEMDRKFKKKEDPESPAFLGLSNPFYWILSNGIYFSIAAFGIAGLTFSWGISDVVFPWFVETFNKEYMLGKVELSLARLAYSILVILLTYLFTRIWKRLTTDYALKESGLSLGAKETVLTITVYIIWSAGILISLNVFGLNTTSLTVAFGALSIGLGFGLQNIANNFISGLILLFERPIQVGDVVEVGGTKGEVKKINVRSTLVQTYSNSSLIIPNSEFISATVTNWSHRDPNLRRDLLLGVAYGSDTELVKTLLLQAAQSVSEVSAYPKKPSVQFINFGDSSLDFRLRFWSTIDDFIDAESKLRFEIDRLFRQHKVVIPFPQRDLHILTEVQGDL